MHKQTWLTCLLALGVAGCPDIKTDPGEGVGELPTGGPTVDFDPANAVLPFPNNLALDPTTGKVALPVQCGEGPIQKALREGVLNKLDGFGTYETAMQVTFSEALDPTSLEGHVVMYQRTKQGSPIAMPGTAIPVLLVPSMSIRYDSACANPKAVTALTIIPKVPLEQKSSYDVAVTAGVKTATGTAFGATFTWTLISNTNAPVTIDASGTVTANHTPLDPADPAGLAQLKGIAQLWKAHKQALDFLTTASVMRKDILVAWEFNTQTTTDPLDPSVTDSPASKVLSAGPLGTQSLLVGPTGDPITATQFLTGAGLPCGPALPCNAIGEILGGLMGSTSYQQDLPNPLTGGAAIPGPWNDPVHPTMTKVNQIQFLASIPAGTMPTGGWPTVVFGHGLGSTKKSMFVIAPLLASKGFAVVAIDFVDHDSRAVRTSTDANLGCANSSGGSPPDPTVSPQCFALFLSTDLAGTRDNIRQTVLDLEREIAMLKACDAAAPAAPCGVLQVDPTNLFYMGISLGGIIGSTTVAAVPDFKAAVLNVPGMGLLDILENTANLSIRCSLVNALIEAGILMGDKWTGGTTGLCTTDAWKAQASYQVFSSTARWVLDPADGANFAAKLAPKKILIQEVVGDQVVPNIATDREGALVGLMPLVADPATAFPPPPSVAITTDPSKNKWVRYPTLPANGPFPGNAFQHASLLAPVANADGTPSNAGLLGTGRLQSDAVEFLVYQHAH